MCETLLAGGDFLTDVDLLRSDATQQLRGPHALPSHDTLWRFCNEADLGRVSKAAAVNRAMIARAWQAGGAPPRGVLTIDPDATIVETHGAGKQDSTFTRLRVLTGMSPMVGVFAETEEVCALRARGGNAHPSRGLASFIDECIWAIPAARRDDYQLWLRIDSAGFSLNVFEAAERHDAWFSITARNTERVAAAIDALLADPEIVWRPAAGNEHDRGSEIAEISVVVGPMTSRRRRTLRLIVRRQPVEAGTQLSFDDRHAWRFHAIVTNIPETDRDAVAVEQHHRLRGGVPEDVIRQLKEDFGFSHAPLSAFHGNWLWWHACALAYNTALWLRRLPLPAAFRRVRGKRLRLAFLNVAARVGSHARRIQLKFARGYRWLAEFTTAVARLHVLPAFH